MFRNWRFQRVTRARLKFYAVKVTSKESLIKLFQRLNVFKFLNLIDRLSFSFNFFDRNTLFLLYPCFQLLHGKCKNIHEKSSQTCAFAAFINRASIHFYAPQF